ncbi:MAG TPA: hypothetical protein VM261_12460 [Kofleriaceae bacterium]|nr:hypothetical protein [Kofleriaceae bacterium]
MTETFSFEINADVYRIHRRPNSPHVVVNDAYRGIRVFDPRTGQDVMRVGFSPGYATSGIVDGWAFRADGDLVATFNDESRSGSVFSLTTGASRAVAHPGWPSTTGMPYDWRGDTLWSKDPESFSFATIDTTTGFADEVEGDHVLKVNRLWRRSLDRMRRLHAVSLRVEPELAQALVRVAADEPKVGRIGWVDQPDVLVPAPSGVFQLASLGERIVVLAEYEFVVLESNGTVVIRHKAPEGFHFVGVDTLPATGDAPAVIVTVASALDGSGVSRFTSYL